jgi:hypothetical protein
MLSPMAPVRIDPIVLRKDSWGLKSPRLLLSGIVCFRNTCLAIKLEATAYRRRVPDIGRKNTYIYGWIPITFWLDTPGQAMHTFARCWQSWGRAGQGDSSMKGAEGDGRLVTGGVRSGHASRLARAKGSNVLRAIRSWLGARTAVGANDDSPAPGVEDSSPMPPAGAPSFEPLEPRLLLDAHLSDLQPVLTCGIPCPEPTVYVDLDQQDDSIQTDLSLVFTIDNVTPCDETDLPASAPALTEDATAQVGREVVAQGAAPDSSAELEDDIVGPAVPDQQDIVSGQETQPIEIRGPPDLPGLRLVDPDISNWQGQIIYFDFDGEEGVTYDGTVTVGPFDVPAFQACGELAGQEQAIITEVLTELGQIFADSGVIFTTEWPATGIPYSTIYIGGGDSAFAQYGSFLGLAEQVDIGNADTEDNAFVFAHELAARPADWSEYVARLTQLIAHEAGHLLGYEHAVCGGSEGDSLARCAAVFYVDQSDPQANDSNAGAEALPLKTIDRALTLVQPGDHVYIKGSTNPDAPEAIYDRSNNDGLPIQRPGTAAGKIVIEAYPGHTVILQGNGTHNGISLDYASYHDIRGFVFRDFNKATEGFAAKTDILIENCEFTITHETGLRLRNITNLTLRDVNVHHCFEAGIYIINSSHVRLERVTSSFNDDLQGAAGDGDGFDTVEVDDFVGVDCTAEGNSEDGFDLISDGSLVNCVSRNNNVCGVKVWSSTESGYRLRKMTLTNCLVSENGETGIKVSLAAALDLFNSVVYGNGENDVAFRSTTIVATPVYSRIFNTIIAGSGSNGILVEGTAVNVVDASNNLYYQNASANSGLHSDTWSISGQDPLLVDPASGLFQLLSGSPAVDHGLIISGYHCSTAGDHPDQNLHQWYGSAPDIGAYEVALSPIVDLAVTGTGPDSISLVWTVPGDPLLMRKPTAYDIRYADTPLTDSNWATAVQVPNELTAGDFGQAQSFVITGLNGTSTLLHRHQDDR